MLHEAHRGEADVDEARLAAPDAELVDFRPDRRRHDLRAPGSTAAAPNDALTGGQLVALEDTPTWNSTGVRPGGGDPPARGLQTVPLSEKHVLLLSRVLYEAVWGSSEQREIILWGQTWQTVWRLPSAPCSSPWPSPAAVPSTVVIVLRAE